jgi:hypothetical protein
MGRPRWGRRGGGCNSMHRPRKGALPLQSPAPKRRVPAAHDQDTCCAPNYLHENDAGDSCTVARVLISLPRLAARTPNALRARRRAPRNLDDSMSPRVRARVTAVAVAAQDRAAAQMKLRT